MTDMEDQLLGKSEGIKTQFQILQEKLSYAVEELRIFNDQQQSIQLATLQYGDIQNSKKQFKIKAEKIKEQIAQIEKIALGNEKKNIVNKLKSQYSKEIERQKRIMKSFINSSFEQKFARISVIRQSKAHGMETQQEQLKYFVDQSYVKIVPRELRSSVTQQDSKNQVHAEEQRTKAVSIDEDLIERDMIDLENMLIDERQQELDIIEKEAYQLNVIANEMGGLVDQQGNRLDEGQQNLNHVKYNVIAAQNEISLADGHQSRNKKIYIAIVVVLIVAVIVLLIIVLAK